MHLISASRRTDLPAFYADWLMQRIRSGSASWVNPFNGAVSTVSLLPQDVAAIIFWTRNFSPMHRHLDELEDRGYRYLIHFTLTGLPRIYETHVPTMRSAVGQMRALAERIGPQRVLWRYDPILISRDSDFDFHRSRFEDLSRQLEGATRQCSVSFVQIYGKVRRNFTRRGLPLPDPSDRERRELAAGLAEIGARHGIVVRACCSDELLGNGVEKARCVDRDQVLGVWPGLSFEAAAAPTREECGCSRSFDIGAYDTCLHGCLYCYATRDRETAQMRHQRHQAACATLLPVANPSP